MPAVRLGGRVFVGRNPNWTAAEKETLEEMWGKSSIPYIAKTFNKSIDAIKLKAGRMNLGPHLQGGKEITFMELMRALGRTGSFGYIKNSWPEHEFPMRYKKVNQCKFAVVDIDDFWKWAKKHKWLLDFSRFETNALGKEPGWVPIKRRADIMAAKYKTSPWTKTEDDHLISLLNAYKYGYREISIKLYRTEGAIKRRIGDLGLKQRPIKADNHTPWTMEEIEIVFKLVEDGYKPQVIAEYVNRSALAIRGLLERTFENEVYKMVVKC